MARFPQGAYVKTRYFQRTGWGDCERPTSNLFRAGTKGIPLLNARRLHGWGMLPVGYDLEKPRH